MAVNPLSTFAAVPSPYGGLIILSWTYPSPLPAAWQLYLFRKRGANPDQGDINSYFAGELDDEQLRQKGLYVFRDLPASTSFLQFKDLAPRNEQTYYYRAVVKDTATGEYSATKDANAICEPNIKIHTVDGKRTIVRAVEKSLDTLKSSTGTKISVPKDLRVYPDYPSPDQKEVFIVVQRVSGQLQERYLDSFVAQYKDGLVRGEVDIEVLQVEWIAIGTPDRRDQITNIMRALRLIQRFYILQLGNGAIKDVRFVLMGDTEGEYSGQKSYRGAMNVTILAEQQLQVGSSVVVGEWTSVITDVEGIEYEE